VRGFIGALEFGGESRVVKSTAAHTKVSAQKHVSRDEIVKNSKIVNLHGRIPCAA
jgi:hypothetical protein